jgi:hypothetical protein
LIRINDGPEERSEKRSSYTEGSMDRTSTVPVVVALIVAFVGSAVLYNMDFVHHTVVRNNGIRKISREALARAGAIATPTPQDVMTGP